jgi:hypothetical protein
MMVTTFIATANVVHLSSRKTIRDKNDAVMTIALHCERAGDVKAHFAHTCAHYHGEVERDRGDDLCQQAIFCALKNIMDHLQFLDDRLKEEENSEL